ncbi:MAG: hypothetical protein ACJ747_01960 [Gaiellaceae bacterium]|jgi:hypothetical protein
MGNDARAPEPAPGRKKPSWAIPRPTPHFRRRAWAEFQRALDPLASPRPLEAAEGRLKHVRSSQQP